MKKIIYINMKLKQEYLDMMATNPLTNKDVVVRFIPKDLYEVFSKSHPYLFEEDEIIIEKEKEKE